MNIYEKENLIRIIEANHENDMEEEKKKFIKSAIDRIEETLSKFNCVCINREEKDYYIRATLGYDFSFASDNYQEVSFMFTLFKPNILFDKKDYLAEMESRGYKNLTIDFTNQCIQFDVYYIYDAVTGQYIFEESKNEQEEK